MTRRADVTLFELGSRVRDRLTGIEGIMLAMTTWHNRSHEIAIQREGLDSDGHGFQLHWCPQARVEPT